ncbi:MAG: YggT family protein [Treponema sp.]|nr:YggT family protein [Treponema sp.]
MKLIIDILASAVSLYSILIFVRIIISWFGRAGDSKPVELLGRITDPYIDWWRKILNLRLGFLDLSPLVAIAALSVVRTILYIVSTYERISIGTVLAVILLSVWSIVSFILGFCIIVLVLRIFAYLTNRDIYTPFWKVVESISQPLLYKTNRLIFGNKIENYLKGIIVSTLIMTAIWIGGGFIMPALANLLAKLPL